MAPVMMGFTSVWKPATLVAFQLLPDESFQESRSARSCVSGTNNKAGGEFNFILWITPRTIKETSLHANEYRYPIMIEK